MFADGASRVALHRSRTGRQERTVGSRARSLQLDFSNNKRSGRGSRDFPFPAAGASPSQLSSRAYPHCPGAAQESSPWKITFWCRRPPGVAFFELAVQRGVIAQLLHQKLLSPAHPSLEPWHTSRVSEVTKGVLKALAVTDNNAREWVESGVRHLLVFGYGLGWTTMRECLKHNAPKNPQIEALWCPLTLPGQEGKFEEEQEKTAISFHQAFQLPGSPDKAVTHKGNPGKADFLLWLKSGGTHRRRSKRPKDFLLCLEFSYNAPGKTGGLQD